MYELYSRKASQISEYAPKKGCRRLTGHKCRNLNPRNQCVLQHISLQHYWTIKTKHIDALIMHQINAVIMKQLTPNTRFGGFHTIGKFLRQQVFTLIVKFCQCKILPQNYTQYLHMRALVHTAIINSISTIAKNENISTLKRYATRMHGPRQQIFYIATR